MMPLANHKFVAIEDIRNATDGSYEQRIAAIEAAITDDRERLFGTTGEIQVVGTFASHAVVVSEDTKFYKVYLTEDGIPTVAQVFEVPTYSLSKLATMRKAQASQVAESLASNDTAKALQGLENLVSDSSLPNEDVMVDSLLSAMRQDRVWKKVFRARAQTMEAYAQSMATSDRTDRLRTKFARLYDGSTLSEDRDTLRKQVVEAFEGLAKDIGELRVSTESASKLLIGLLATVNSEGSEALAAFGGFAEDLAVDLKEMLEVAQGAPGWLGGTDQLARLYDAMAAEFFNHEVAGRFVSKLTQHLSEATP